MCKYFIREISMKTQNMFLVIIVILFLLPSIGFTQNMEVHNLIGKSRNEVIKKYGAPVHKDESNPDMICMFYKNKTSSMIFVSDQSGVYQAEATKSYDTQAEARSIVDSFISNSLTNGFAIDTVSTSDFRLQKKGVKVDLQISENKLAKTFDVKVKANKTES